MSDSQPILPENRAALERQPQLLAQLQSVEPYPEDATSRAKSGEPVLSLADSEGVVRPLHSRHQPRLEARRQLPEFEDPLTSFVFLGAGLGYGPLELVEKLSDANTLIWIEPDVRLFRTLVATLDVSRVLGRSNTILVVGGAREDLFRLLHENTADLFGSPIKLVAHPASQQLWPDVFAEYREAVGDFTRDGAVRLRTTFYLARVALRNQAENLGAYVPSVGIQALEGALEGQPAVVVAAGPSLRKNMAQLREAVGKITIIAVSTTLRRLLAEGIRPDFTVLIDYHRISRRYFEGIDPAEAPPMICQTRATPIGVEAYPGPLLFGNDLFFNTLLDGVPGNKGDLPASSTVAHAAFHVAKWMRADPVVLLGQDLSYAGGVMHVPGTAIQTQVYPQTHRFYSMEAQELEYYLTNRPRFRKVPALDDGEVPTCDVFFSYLREFELMFAGHDGRVIDATEGGARIEGTEVQTLRQVLGDFSASQRPDLSALLLAAEAGRDVGALQDSVHELLLKRTEELDELQRLYRRMLALLEKVLRRNDDGEAADQTVAQVQKLHEESKQFGVVYLMLSGLAQSDVWERRRRDRRIDAGQESGVAKQALQARRDREYVLGLIHAAEFLLECLRTARETVEATRALTS